MRHTATETKAKVSIHVLGSLSKNVTLAWQESPTALPPLPLTAGTQQKGTLITFILHPTSPLAVTITSTSYPWGELSGVGPA